MVSSETKIKLFMQLHVKRKGCASNTIGILVTCPKPYLSNASCVCPISKVYSSKMCSSCTVAVVATTGAQVNSDRLFFNFPFMMVIKEGNALSETYGQTDTVSHWQVK